MTFDLANPAERVFLDTGYLIAILNANDGLHPVAEAWQPFISKARQVVVTEAILDELGNHFADKGAEARDNAAKLIDGCYATPNVKVVPVDGPLFGRGVTMYASRPDQTWSLTDCVSFVVMDDEDIQEAAAHDKHFEQAGMVALLRREPPPPG